MKTKWNSFLILGLVLLLTGSVVGCGESYTQEDLESKYEALLLEKAILKAELETMQADITYLRDASETLRDDYDALKVLYEDVKNELSEVKKSSEPEPSSEVTSVSGIPPLPEESISYPELPSKLPTELGEESLIEDLAYIKASTWRYSDDADPEWEGVSISVSYYNFKSELMYFTGVPFNVTVELYWYTNFPPIYQKQVMLDSSGGLFTEIVRIPYEGIQEKPSGMTRGPILILTVNIPNQGVFEVQDTMSGFIWP